LTDVTDDHNLDELQAVYDDFVAGRYDQVIERAGALGQAGGDVAEALAQAAQGLSLEADGQPDEAAKYMERALALGIALPALLATLARYFRRNERQLLAHYAFLMHDLHRPGAMEGFVIGAPEGEQARYAPWAVRHSMTVSEPDLYALAHMKAALSRRHGPGGAAMILASMAAPGHASRAQKRPLRRLIDHAHEHGRNYEELIPAAEVTARWPRVFETDAAEAPETYLARSRVLFTSALDDVIVTGKSNLLLTRGVALLDTQDDELSRISVDLRVDPLVGATEDGSVVVSAPADPQALRQIPEAIWLTGVHSSAFGHWIIEFLPKAWAFMASSGGLKMPVLIDRQMPRQHIEALRFFAGPLDLIVIEPGEQVRVEQLWIASQLVYLPVGPLPGEIARPGDAVIDATGLRRLMQPLLPKLEALDLSEGPSHVHLARPEQGRRQLLNAEELEAGLAENGYESFHLGDLDFAEQLRVIRGAERVVGPDGSAMMMTLFGKPGLRIGVYSHPYLEEFEWYTQASEASEHELTVMTGTVVREDLTYRNFSDYRIDPIASGRFLDSLEATLKA